jgi:Bor protein
MHGIRRAVLALASLASTACYHAVVETGRTPGSTVIVKPWTNTFIFGLVPAAEISTAAQCPSGVARVETQQSFVNGLVGVVTLGIYTPQEVRITCASGGTGALPANLRRVRVGQDATLQEKVDAVNAAAEQSRETGAPVLVQF